MDPLPNVATASYRMWGLIGRITRNFPAMDWVRQALPNDLYCRFPEEWRWYLIPLVLIFGTYDFAERVTGDCRVQFSLFFFRRFPGSSSHAGSIPAILTRSTAWHSPQQQLQSADGLNNAFGDMLL